MKKYVLGYPIKGGRILLIYKKRGFGKGLYNGFGGKLEAGENSQDALKREASEEIGIYPISFHRVARLYFTDDVGTDMGGDVYLITQWSGSIIESDEAKPVWFDMKSLPFEYMWEDDKIWLPLVLKGNKITAHFHFDDLHSDKPKILRYKVIKGIYEEIFVNL